MSTRGRTTDDVPEHVPAREPEQEPGQEPGQELGTTLTADDELPIGAVAERSGLAVSALRFYETHGLIRSTRTAGGQRRYPRDVLRRLAVVRAAQQVGFTLAEIQEMLVDLPNDHHVTGAEWRSLAQSWQPQIDERIRTLERLRDQLDRCIGCGCLSLRSCAFANPDDRVGHRGPGPRFWVAAPG